MTVMVANPRTIIEKIWDEHVVAESADDQCLLQVDRIVLHDRAGGVEAESGMGPRGHGLGPE